VTPAIVDSLNKAADSGPRALIARLETVLAENPELAASAESAGALARAASLPVSGFLGANVPVYRDIAARIINAAPEAARPAVSRAVVVEVRRAAAADPTVREPLVGDVNALLAEARALAGRVSQRRGIALGSFILYPEAQLTGYYDDNIFATKTSRVDDYVTVFGPHVFLVSNWEQHRLEFEAHTDIVRFAENERENTEDFWFAGEGRYDISKATNLFGGLLFGRFHEDRESPEDVNGLEPTVYSEARAFAGASHTVGDFTGRFGATWERSRFDDTPTSTFTINNSDRDREHITVGGRLTYRIDDTYRAYGDATGDLRNYRTTVDDNGFDRDSDGFKAVVGAQFIRRGVADGGAYVGFMRQSYDDAALERISAAAFGANVRWRFLPSTVVSAWADRTIEDTTLFGSPGYIYTSTGLTLEHDVTSRLRAVARASYALSDFSGVARSDDEYDTSAGLRFDVTGNVYLAGDYRYQKRISSISVTDYKRHQVFLRLGANF